jgi:hypothetical protein
MPSTPETCPNCGADLPPRAKVCPDCGADEKTGWSDTAYAQDLELPDDSFDYDEFVEKEFAEAPPIKPRGLAWVWWLVALLLIAGLLALMFAR